jgi:hypothetical protein
MRPMLAHTGPYGPSMGPLGAQAWAHGGPKLWPIKGPLGAQAAAAAAAAAAA